MTKYGYLGHVTTNQLWSYLLGHSPSLPGEVLKNESPSPAKRPSKKRVEQLMLEEAKMRRFRLTAKSRRAKVAALPLKPVGITSKGAGISRPAGTKRTAGASVSTAMTPSTGTEIKRFWLASRTCSHCGGVGLWSKGSLADCSRCERVTDLHA